MYLIIFVMVVLNASPLRKRPLQDFYYGQNFSFVISAEKNEKVMDKIESSFQSIGHQNLIQTYVFHRGKSQQLIPEKIKRRKRQEQEYIEEDEEFNPVNPDIHEENYFRVNVVFDSAIIQRTAFKDSRRLWEGKVVPYVLSNQYLQSEVAAIIKGIDEFENRTCLIFKRRENETTYISIAPAEGCSAILGKVQGLNPVTLSKNCFATGIVQHEIMHVFGFFHEQSRPDRDDFVKVMWDNIAERHKPNFEKKTSDEVQTFGQPYDYGSVMHYGRFEFAADRGRPSIIPLKEGVEIGQRDRFSDIDLIKINTLFNCTGRG